MSAERQEYMRRYRDANRERLREADRRYYVEHRDAVRKRQGAYRLANADAIRAHDQEYKRAAAPARRAYQKLYRQTHPDVVSAGNLRHRARKKGAPGVVTHDQLRARIDFYGGRCWVPGCGRSYEAIDHVIPLARGGSNWPANLRPICHRHNSQKRDASLTQFLARRVA